MNATTNRLTLYDVVNRVLLGCITLVVFSIGIMKFVPLIRQNAEVRRELELKKVREARLETELRQRQQRVKALQNDPRTIAREAREQLHLALPDDLVVTFTSSAQTSLAPAPSPGSSPGR